MDYVKFEIKGKIETKGRPRVVMIGKYPRIYTPNNTQKYEKYVRECYCSYTNGANKKYGTNLKPTSFGDKPVEMIITAYFKAPKTLERYGNNIQYGACMKNKDLDNIAKTICDALNGVAYDDDKQIVKLNVSKFGTNNEERVIVELNEPGFLTNDKNKFIHDNYVRKLEGDEQHINHCRRENKDDN